MGSAFGAADLALLHSVREGIPVASRNRGTGLPGNVSGRRSIHLPFGRAVSLENEISSTVSTLINMGVVHFFHRRKLLKRRQDHDRTMLLPPGMGVEVVRNVIATHRTSCHPQSRSNLLACCVATYSSPPVFVRIRLGRRALHRHRHTQEGCRNGGDLPARTRVVAVEQGGELLQ